MAKDAVRSRLYRRQFLRPNTRWKALDKINKLHILLVTLIFKWRILQKFVNTFSKKLYKIRWKLSKIVETYRNFANFCQFSLKGRITFQFSFVLQSKRGSRSTPRGRTRVAGRSPRGSSSTTLAARTWSASRQGGRKLYPIWKLSQNLKSKSFEI